MARKEEFDREEMINAIWEAQGKVSVAAQRLTCAPQTIFTYAKRYTTVQDAIDSARRSWDEKLLDAAEVKLFEQVMDGRAWAVRYALATKGKDRGYVERGELANPPGEGFNIVLSWPTPSEVGQDDQDS